MSNNDVPSPTARFTYPRSGYQALAATVPQERLFSTDYAIPTSYIQVVPVFKSFGYHSLDHGFGNAPVPSSGFFNYKLAYPMDNCGSIYYRKCDAVDTMYLPTDSEP